MLLTSASWAVLVAFSLPSARLGDRAYAAETTNIHFAAKDVLVTSGVNKIYLWDVNSGKPLHKPLSVASVGRLRSLVQKKGLVAAYSSGVLIVSPDSGQIFLDIKAPCYGEPSFDISADERLLALGFSNGAIHVYDLATGKSKCEIMTYAGPIRNIRFSPTSRALLFSREGEKEVLVLTLESLELKYLKGHTGAVECLEVVPHSSIVVTTAQDLTLRLWDSVRLKELQLFKFKARIRAVAASQDGEIFAIAVESQRDSLMFLYTKTCRLEPFLLGKVLHGPLSSVSFAPDKSRIAVLGCRPRVFSVPIAKEVLPPIGHDGAVRDVCFFPKFDSIATGGDDGTVRLWNLREPKNGLLLGVHESTVTSLAACGHDTLLSYGADGKVAEWKLSMEPFELSRFDVGRAGGHLAVSQDCKLVAIGVGGGRVEIWDLETRKKRKVISIDSMWFAPSPFFLRRNLFILGYEGLFVKKEGAPLAHVYSPIAKAGVVHASGGGRYCSFYDDLNNIVVWDCFFGRMKSKLPVGAKHAQSISHDGKWIAVRVERPKPALSIFEVATGNMISTSELEPTTGMSLVRFSPDGKWIVTNGSGYSLLVNRLDDIFSSLLWHKKVSNSTLWEKCGDPDPAVGLSALWELWRREDGQKFILESVGNELAGVERVLADSSSLVAALGSDTFQARIVAEKSLRQRSSKVEYYLRKEMESTTDSEVRQRLARILATQVPGTYDSIDLRQSRLILLCEFLASAEGLDLLEIISKSGGVYFIRHDALEALERLKNRSLTHGLRIKAKGK